MKIGIIGSGSVATTLAKGFIKHGHDVMLGTRDAAKLADFAKANSAARIGSFNDAAAFAEIVVFTVKGAQAEKALALVDARNLEGKTVIDTTNPIAEKAPEQGVLHLFTDSSQSLMERLQAQVPGAHFVKAFSCVGAPAMVNPSFSGGKPTMFIAGNNAGAKEKVAGILGQFGWEVNDMGSAVAARAIEPLVMLWCIPGFVQNDWFHAFRMLR